MATSSDWQTEALARTFLSGVRGAIPGAQAQVDVLLHIVDQWTPNPRAVLDLGCGDGILGHAVLERHPGTRVWFLDFSAPMLAAARERLAADARASFVQADLATSDWLRAVDGVRPDLVTTYVDGVVGIRVDTHLFRRQQPVTRLICWFNHRAPSALIRPRVD